MAREAPRTVLSVCAPYQRDVDPSEYEVIVVDNGSRHPFTPGDCICRAPNLRIVAMPNPRPSPVFAMNWAARNLACGELILFSIDGARIFSDRLIFNCLRAHEQVDDAFVYTLACHLGPKVQMVSTTEGYDAETEDRLLNASGWPDRTEAIYDISVFAGSSISGFFKPISESNAFDVPQTLLTQIGGFDERFTSPGGGLCNLEIFARYVTRAGARNVCLLSDMTFHQTHGGVATSGKIQWSVFDEEYKSIFGQSYSPPTYDSLFLGPIRPEARRFLETSCDIALRATTNVG